MICYAPLARRFLRDVRASSRESDRPANGGVGDANGRNGDATKDVLPGLSADALGDHQAAEDRKKSGPPKRA